MIPAQDCPPGTPADVCCDSAFLIGDRIRTVAFDAVLGCVDESCANELKSYVTHGPRIEDPIGESVIVTWLGSSTIATTPGGRQHRLVIVRNQYRVELREQGFPQIAGEGDNIVIPSPGQFHAAAQHAWSHGESMWRVLLRASVTIKGSDAMFDYASNPHVLENGIAVGDLSPLRDVLVGWGVTVTVDCPLASLPPVGS